MEPKAIRPCGECSKCCQGTLTATVLGHEIGNGKNCSYLGKGGTGCTIHQYRPRVCKDFICEWKGNFNVPLDFRPDKTGVILSTRYFTGSDGNSYEHLRVLDTNRKINTDVYEWILKQYSLKKFENILYIVRGLGKLPEYGILTNNKKFYEQMGKHLGGFDVKDYTK
jgi:hypothetical protein